MVEFGDYGSLEGLRLSVIPAAGKRSESHVGMDSHLRGSDDI